MARQVFILVLVLFAILGVVLAEPPKASTGASSGGASGTPAAESPDSIGPVDDPAGEGDDVVEGPVGGPTPVGEYAAAATSPTTSSDATALQISTCLGGAAAALAGFFF